LKIFTLESGKAGSHSRPWIADKSLSRLQKAAAGPVPLQLRRASPSWAMGCDALEAMLAMLIF
jgi:hypothetical protein